MIKNACARSPYLEPPRTSIRERANRIVLPYGNILSRESVFRPGNEDLIRGIPRKTVRERNLPKIQDLLEKTGNPTLLADAIAVGVIRVIK